MTILLQVGRKLTKKEVKDLFFKLIIIAFDYKIL